MNIYLTLDYELFFGDTPGSLEKCILEPTQKLIEIGERTGAKLTFFIDAGYLWKLNELKDQHTSLSEEFKKVSQQISQLSELGHDCQLHIHPHWEDAVYNNGWEFNVNRYKLKDFSASEVLDIFQRYSQILKSISKQEIHSYRAGGWCLQPFSHVKKAFEQEGIRIDSTVFPGGKNINEVYYYDFSKITSSRGYRFEDDLCEMNENGKFLELPIASHTYSPLFFWQLYGWGRLIPSRHKPIGDGYPIQTKGERKKRLLTKSKLPVSMDGFFARDLGKALKGQSKDTEDFVVIGHPKACTLYSLEKLEKFIENNKESNRFIRFSDRLD